MSAGDSPNYILAIEGMMCQKNCGTTVKNALTSVPGVTAAVVSFPDKEARVWGNDSLSDALVDAVEGVGFDARIVHPISNTTPSGADFILTVEGMMCQKNCGTTVQNALLAVPGVTSAEVSFADKEARVWGKDVTSAMLISAIEDMGFDATVAKESPEAIVQSPRATSTVASPPNFLLAVEGMMCQKNCGTTVQNALLAVPGVTSAEVSFADKEARVWGKDVTSAMLISAIEDMGFDATVKNCDPSHLEEKRIATRVDDDVDRPPDMCLSVPRLITVATCSKDVNETLLAIEGVRRLDIDAQAGHVYIWSNVSIDKICAALAKRGYSATRTSGRWSEKSKKQLLKTPVKTGTATNGTSNASGSKFKDSPLGSGPTSGSNAKTKAKGRKKEDVMVVRKDFTGKALRVAEIKIGGMSCANCVRGVEKGLNKIESISTVRIALLAEKAEVVYDSEGISSDGICKAIVNLGYSARVLSVRMVGDGGGKKEVKLIITGMTCANCVVKVEKVLHGLRGVVEVGVSSMTHKGRVVVDEDTKNAAGARDMIEAVQRMGYGCELQLEGNKDGDGEGHENDEVAIWSKLLFYALVLGVPVTALHLATSHSAAVKMFSMHPAACHGGVTRGQLIMLLLNIPLQFGVGYRYYRSAFLGALHGNFGMDCLVVTGTTITFVYSVVQLLVACGSHVPTVHIFFETSGMLLMFVTLGKFLEAYAKGRTFSAITNLLKMQPRNALLVVPNGSEEQPSGTLPSGSVQSPPTSHSYGSLNGDDFARIQKEIKPFAGPGTGTAVHHYEQEVVREIPVELVQKGDLLKVLPGARIPTDGYIESGHAFIDESMITGESVPQLREKGDPVFGSTVNLQNPIYVRATSVGADSALAQIVRLVEAAQMSKAPVQAYADRIAGFFTPVVLSLAGLTFSVWATLSWAHAIPKSWFEEEYGDPLLFSMLFAISVVVISCPCALGLATPTAIMVGTSVGAANGILIKGGPAFETAHRIDTVIFDKTGTLTEGKPAVTDEVVIGDGGGASSSGRGEPPKDRLLRLAATAEQGSEHPLASAVLKAARARGLELQRLTEDSFESTPGMGVRCICHTDFRSDEVGEVLVGNRSFLVEHEVPTGPAVDAVMREIEIQGKTAICVAVDRKILGVIGIADVPKVEASQAVSALHALGLDVWMVTGDNKTTAEAIASVLDIPADRVVASALPKDKVAKVEELQLLGRSVAVIGDGVNDSPALAKADLGIAIGAGTQVAMEAADMVLVRNNLLDVVVALDLAKVVFRRIKINFMWAFLYNVVAIPGAAGCFFPWTHTLVAPQWAGLSMAFSSISVVLSSISLKLYDRAAVLRRLSVEDHIQGSGDDSSSNGKAIYYSFARDDVDEIAFRERTAGVWGLVTRRVEQLYDRTIGSFAGSSTSTRYSRVPVHDVEEVVFSDRGAGARAFGGGSRAADNVGAMPPMTLNKAPNQASILRTPTAKSPSSTLNKGKTTPTGMAGIRFKVDEPHHRRLGSRESTGEKVPVKKLGLDYV